MPHQITLRYEPSRDPREVRIAFLLNRRPWLGCFVRSSGPPLRPCGEALLCMGLLPAIELACDLRIEEPVDRTLLAAVDDVQRMVAGWTPGCHPVRIVAPTRDAKYPNGRGHGLFFSGGVDSSYSLAVNRNQLDGIVTLLGCDCAEPLIVSFLLVDTPATVVFFGVNVTRHVPAWRSRIEHRAVR